MRGALTFLLLLASMAALASDIVLKTADGRTAHPLKPGSKPKAFVFLLSECPIANAYAPELARIHAAYAKKGVEMSIVIVDPSITAKQAKTHAQAYGLKMPVLLDPKRTLAKAVGITISPEVAVYDRTMKLAYRGRIDDLFYGLGKRRSIVKTHEMRDALDAVLGGKPVPHSRTKAVGCVLG